MRNPHGYSVITDPTFSTPQENDNLCCIHCGKIDMVRSGLSGNMEVMVFRSDGTHYFRECGFCRSCYEPICPMCNGKPCNNRFRRLEEQEKAAKRFICS